MLYLKIKKDEEFSNVASSVLEPSSAFCYIGYEDNVSGKITLKIKTSDLNIPSQSICTDSVVVPITLTNTTNLNYQLGDIFYADNIEAGDYIITVSKLGGPELRGKSVLLYLNEAPIGTNINFGGYDIINTTEVGSYCITFCNLQGTNIINCLSVWKTPGAIANAVLPVEPEPEEPELEEVTLDTPLTFTGKAATNAICLQANPGYPHEITLQYSKNGDTWTNYTIGNVIELDLNDTVAFSGANDIFNEEFGYYNFVMTGTIEAFGNAHSLTNFDDIATSGCFYRLFADCESLVDASRLCLSPTVTEACYYLMFYGCTNLSSAPLLPATTLAEYCYYGMFTGCSNLSSASALPATTLAEQCYSNMFMGCTNLSSAPQLLATELCGSCYADMFAFCTSLTTAPTLPATTLADNCYYLMFKGCSNLSSISVAFTDWSDGDYTYDWVVDIANNGTFTCPTALGDNSTITRGTNYCPLNWTVVNPQ